jgi:hypothetical protein
MLPALPLGDFSVLRRPLARESFQKWFGPSA